MLFSLILTLVLIFLSNQFINWWLKSRISNWRNQTSHAVIPSEEPTFPFVGGGLDSVNFFGREKSKKLGDIYCVWSLFTPILVIGNGKAADDYYKIQSENTKDYSFLGWVFHATMGDSLGLSYRKRWKEMRNVFARYEGREEKRQRRRIRRRRRCFNGDFVKNQFTAISSAVDKWMAKNINKRMSNGSVTIDLDDPNFNTLITYGEMPIDGKEMAHLLYFLDMHEKLVSATNNRLTRLPGYRFLPTPTNKLVAEFLHQWAQFNNRMIEDCYAKKPETDNSILRFLIDNGVDQKLTSSEIFQTLYEITLFNVDITRNALVCILSHVAGEPKGEKEIGKIQQELYNELDQVYREDGAWTNSNINNMKFLDAIVKESARMNPSLTVSFPEKTTVPVIIDGYYIPAQTQVCIDAHTLNYNPRHWENPETFDPSRFTKETNETHTAYHRFGIGARKCLGSKYADTALKLVCARIFHEFQAHTFTRPNKTKKEGFVFFIPFVNTSSLVLSQRGKL